MRTSEIKQNQNLHTFKGRLASADPQKSESSSDESPDQNDAKTKDTKADTKQLSRKNVLETIKANPKLSTAAVLTVAGIGGALLAKRLLSNGKSLKKITKPLEKLAKEVSPKKALKAFKAAAKSNKKNAKNKSASRK